MVRRPERYGSGAQGDCRWRTYRERRALRGAAAGACGGYTHRVRPRAQRSRGNVNAGTVTIKGRAVQGPRVMEWTCATRGCREARGYAFANRLISRIGG